MFCISDRNRRFVKQRARKWGRAESSPSPDVGQSPRTASHRVEDSAQPPRSFSQAARSSESRRKEYRAKGRQRTHAPRRPWCDWIGAASSRNGARAAPPRRVGRRRRGGRARCVTPPWTDRSRARRQDQRTRTKSTPWLPETHPAVPAPRFRSPVHVRGARRVLRYSPDILDRRQVRREVRPSSGAPSPPRAPVILRVARADRVSNRRTPTN